mgnify:CR=1 FL=1
MKRRIRKFIPIDNDKKPGGFNLQALILFCIILFSRFVYGGLDDGTNFLPFRKPLLYLITFKKMVEAGSTIVTSLVVSSSFTMHEECGVFRPSSIPHIIILYYF